ncbi:sugar phosphate isomerase/epimerase family protein [Phytobacter sp. AG2a]
MMKRALLAGLLMIAGLGASAHAKTSEDPIALQMYTLRNVGEADKQFAMAGEAGFRNVELVGTHGLDVKSMKRLLSKNHLNVVAAHVQLSALETEYANTVSFNKAVGNTHIVVPWIEPADRPDSASGWAGYAKRLDTMGAKLRKDGMTLAYHNHNFEMKKYGADTALDIIMKNTQRENLMLELDAAWVARGGQDPAQVISRYSGRVYAIHAKDNAGIGVRDDEMNFAPLGEGLLDWKSVLTAARKSGVQWYIVEHDAPKDAWSIITTSRENLKKQLQQQP